MKLTDKIFVSSVSQGIKGTFFSSWSCLSRVKLLMKFHFRLCGDLLWTQCISACVSGHSFPLRLVLILIWFKLPDSFLISTLGQIKNYVQRHLSWPASDRSSGREIVETIFRINSYRLAPATCHYVQSRQWSYQDIRLVTQRVVQNVTTWPCLPCLLY